MESVIISLLASSRSPANTLSPIIENSSAAKLLFSGDLGIGFKYYDFDKDNDSEDLGHTLISFAGYSFLTSMPVLSFMLFIASRFENMWVPLGIGVAGFLSGMALATSDIVLFMVHPFVVMLKPAVAMSAQPDIAVIIVSLAETILFLCTGLWAAKKLRYE